MELVVEEGEVDQTAGGLTDQAALIRLALQALLAGGGSITFVDEERFADFLATKGPGAAEYWAYALAEPGGAEASIPPEIEPDIILVPLCITERAGGSPAALRYRFEVKGLEVKRCRYFIARATGETK